MKLNIKHNLIAIALLLISVGCDDGSSNPVIPEEHTDADGLVLELNGQEVYREFEGEYVTTLSDNISLSVGDEIELSVHFLDSNGDEIDSDSDDHDHDHDDDHDDAHCDDYSTESECTAIESCEWHSDENACESAADHDEHGDDHDDVHCDDYSTESECTAIESCEWHSDENACESAADHDEHGDDENGLVISIANSDIVTITVEGNEEDEANNQGNGIHINAVSAGSTNFTIQLMHEGHSDYISMPIAIQVSGN